MIGRAGAESDAHIPPDQPSTRTRTDVAKRARIAPLPPLPVTFTTHSRNAASGSAPLFIACSVSRAVISACRNSCGVYFRAHAAWFFTRQSGCLSAAAIPRPCPRAAILCAHMSSRMRVTHMGSSAWGDTDFMRCRSSRHFAVSRAANAFVNSQGLTSAVRLTSDRTSCSPTAAVPEWARATFLISASR